MIGRKNELLKAAQSGNIDFTIKVTDLHPDQIYYFRIFATTEWGTGYGEQMSYSTRSLAETTWDFHFIHNEEGGVIWHADVTFYEDGTAFYTEPDYPGVYDIRGTWSLEGDQLYYDMVGDEDATSYILKGTVEDEKIKGTYTWGEEDLPWIASRY